MKYKYFARPHTSENRKVVYRWSNNVSQFWVPDYGWLLSNGHPVKAVEAEPISRDSARKLYPEAFK